jgi:Tfp pilus assembly protein FimT
MKKNKYTLSVVDLLIGVAVLMILAALFVPHFVQPSQKGKSAAPAQRAATVHPGR